MANKKTILNRLAGLETEYAIRFHPHFPDETRPSNRSVYQLLTAALSERIPTAKAFSLKDGLFTACGGAFWFEMKVDSADSGLCEGATPECRGPRELLRYQRAQDRLLAEITPALHPHGSISLLKNDRDAFGNFYGAQENYEAQLGSWFDLLLWRAGLVLLFPLSWATWLLLILFMLIGAICVLPILCVWKFEDDASGEFRLPRRLQVFLLQATSVLVSPMGVPLALLFRFTAFRRIRRQLLPFLISRSVIGGSGVIEHDGTFHIGCKLRGLVCLQQYWVTDFSRPLFNFGNFAKSVMFYVLVSPRTYLHLFRARQRFQFNLGDSNMADEAEYLRIGTTMLILDVIEAGELPPVPRFGRPIHAMRVLGADTGLQAAVSAVDGSSWTALQLQRFYWQACETFLSKRLDAPEEARFILNLWGQVLDTLRRDPRELIGRIDWVTKQFLLNSAGRDLSFDAKKKIDIRYHELSPHGYFQRLHNTEIHQPLLQEEEIKQAQRVPPPNSPATLRGRYIREFSSSEKTLRADWYRVMYRVGRRYKSFPTGDF